MKVIQNNYVGATQTICPECSSILEIEKSDIIEVPELDPPNPAEYRAAYKYYICPCCKHKILVNR